MSDRNLVGNGAAFIAAAVFGASVVATRAAVGTVPPLSLAFLRFGQGGLLMLLFLLLRRPGVLRIKLGDFPYLVLMGAVMFTVFPVTFNVGLKFTEASRGALMLSTMPLWSAWFARIARSERLTFRQVGGIVLTLGGVAAAFGERGLTWQPGTTALLGDSLMLLTAVSGAIYGVLAQKMLRKYNVMAVTTYAMLTGTCLLIPAALVEGLPQAFTRIDPKAACLILFLGICGGALAYYLWTFALARLTPTRVAVYVNLNPMVATILGAALLSERLTSVFVLCFVAVLAGVLLVNWPARSGGKE